MVDCEFCSGRFLSVTKDVFFKIYIVDHSGSYNSSSSSIAYNLFNEFLKITCSNCE